MVTPGARKSDATSRRVLKIVSKCNTEDEFVAVFQRFCDDESLFVVTRKPKSVGSHSRFAVTLASGKPMLLGSGRVVASYEDKENPFGRPGMKILFTNLDNESIDNLKKLNAARDAAKAREQGAGKPPEPRNGAAAGDTKANGASKAAAGKPGEDKATSASPLDRKAKSKTIMGTPVPTLGRVPLKIPSIPKIESTKAARPEATPAPKPLGKPRPGTPIPIEDAPTAKLDAKHLGNKKTMAVAAVPLPVRPAGKTDGKADDKADGNADAKADAKPGAKAGDETEATSDTKADANAKADAYEEEITQVKPEGPPSDGVPVLDEEITTVSPDNQHASSESPTGEERAEGSDFVLPANPFGTVDESSLEAFVECTMYEVTGTFALGDIPGDDPDADVPAWWPEGGSDPTKTPLPPAAPGMVPHGDMTGEVRVDQTPVPVPGNMAMAPTAPMGSHQLAQASAVAPGTIAPIQSRRPAWLPIVATAVITAIITLVIGSLLFGSNQSDSSDSERKPTGAEAPPAPAAAATTETTPSAPATPPAATDDPTAPENPVAPENPEAAEAPAAKADGDDGNAETKDDDGAAAAGQDDDPDADDPDADDPDADDPDPDDPDPETAEAEAPLGAPPADDECKLALTANTTNARAYVDGKKLGRIPLTASVPCDAKMLEVRHPRYRIYEKPIRLTPGTVTRQRIPLYRPTFQLRLVSYPSGATVYVDGRKVGKAPLTMNAKGFLHKRVKMVKAGYKPKTIKVYPKKQRTFVRARLERIRR